MSQICSHRHVRSFDNFLRPYIHNCHKLFADYVRPGMRVLDLGCGAGFATLALADMVGGRGEVVAVDLQQEMLDILKQRLAGTDLENRVRLQCCSADDLDVPGRFDFINAFYMVHEVGDKRAFFREAHGALAHQAHLFIAEPLFHVSAKEFELMLETAVSCGLAVTCRPRVMFSRAVVFQRG